MLKVKWLATGKSMEEFSKLLTSVAALLGAVAWPGIFLVVVLIFRNELKSVLNKVPIILDRMKKASLAGVVLELDRVAEAEAESGADKSGKITARQIEAAEFPALQQTPKAPEYHPFAALDTPDLTRVSKDRARKPESCRLCGRTRTSPPANWA